MGGGVCQLANFSTFQLFDLLGSRKVGDLETWRGKASTQEGVRKCCRVWDVWPRYAVGCPPAGAGGRWCGVWSTGGVRRAGATVGGVLLLLGDYRVRRIRWRRAQRVERVQTVYRRGKASAGRGCDEV